MQKRYDYIIAGAGLAGLSLAYKIRQHQSLKNKSILLIDKDHKNKNDRTWSYWSKDKELFESIIYKKWNKITFASDGYLKEFDISPYAYKMIRGIDFYNHVIAFLKKADKTDFIYKSIDNVISEGEVAKVVSGKYEYSAPLIFKSYYENVDFSHDQFVWQHFKGWVIETKEDTFDEDNAFFMDFRVDQDNETRFFYVLPKNKRKALVEIAIFSNDIPESKFYDPYLQNYITEKLQIREYSIAEEELGAIPMTTFNFNKKQAKGIINIGTNGGSVKASSGYAFKRIQDETDIIINHILKGSITNYKKKKSRYNLYDRTLLNAILSGKTSGKKVFENLFKKIKPQTIFKFLDEKGSLFTDLRIFMGPPTWPFLKAFIEEIKKKN